MSEPKMTRALAVLACVAAVLTGTGTTTAAARPGASERAAMGPAKSRKPQVPLRTVRISRIPAGDEIVSGRGDENGWHLYAAGAGDWSWKPLATLAPAGVNPGGQRWTGRQCLTQDGRYVVTVVAPWGANNSASGMNRGGIAYAVNAHTGAVRPLVTGVSLHYFTPSCGLGGSAALTQYTDADQRHTRLVRVEASTGTVTEIRDVAGELTGAVPAPGGGFWAARDNTIVKVVNGKESVRARLAGRPFELTANAGGGVDFLLGVKRSATIWSLGPAGARQVGTGGFADLRLYGGRNGRTLVAGADHLDATSGMRALPRARTALEAVSLGGSAVSPSPATRRSSPARDGAVPRTALGLRVGARHRSWMPDVAAPAFRELPRTPTIGGTLTPAAGTRGGGNRALRPQDQVPPGGDPSFTSDCAVPRNDVYLQAMQPSPQMVDWAANLAGRGLLTGSAARPAGYANLGLPGYSPSLDFSLPAPFGSGGRSIPREVLDAIFAQESNFKQASWHSVQGVAGNPLTADYYGAGGGYIVGVQTPDCGYGLGQVTSGMTTGSPSMSYDLQRKVAVDYAENAAAAAQILAQKWNELADAGIRANDSNPDTLENWFLALWDYNSGLHPNTGSGPWGLGWANNPANPAYPYNRHPFLHQDLTPLAWQVTYDDASHPGDWPYEEKVMGWMEVPIIDSLSGLYSYKGTLMESHDGINDQRPDAYELARPAVSQFCDIDLNECQATSSSAECTRADYECWWHYPASWCDPLTNACHGGQWTYNAGDSEPPAPSPDYYPGPVCDVDTAAVPPGSTIVDSQASGINLQGCDPATDNWRNSGSFAFTYGDPANPGSQATDMDVHQLGTGLSGHIWFTHTDEPTDGNGVSLWGVTGTWTPNLAKGRYAVKVFVPAAGATATEARYTVDNGLGIKHTVTVNQNAYTDEWVTLGKFWLGPGASVALTNLGVTSDGDLAFSGVAFTPTSSGDFVMLGDSYSSGEGAGQGDLTKYDSGTTSSTSGGVNTGHRSSLAYNRLFAAGTATFGKGGTWSDVACSGAITDDFFSVRSTGKCPNEGAQETALIGYSDPSLVTLSFGGNDLDFAPIILACVKYGLHMTSTSCESAFPNLDSDITALASPTSSTGLSNLYNRIRSDAPDAEVVVMGYPHLVRPSSDPNGGCAASGYIVPSDRDWLNREADKLDSELEAAAKAAGFTYISVTSDFDDHELCSSSPWLYGPGDFTSIILSKATPEEQQQWFHPNAAGYAYEANRLFQILPIP